MKKTLQSYFHASALREADRPALFVGGKHVSYAELRQAAGRISSFLRANVQGNGQHAIGILCEKSLSAYAGLLGAMESGNIYVPLKPNLPLNRLEYMAKHAGVKALVVDSRSVGKAAQLLELLGKDIVVYLPDNETIPAELKNYTVFTHYVAADAASTPPSAEAGLDRADGNTAYLLFTSGTTGTPKGVPVSHENACACIEGVCEHFKIYNTDRFTQFSELSFDVSLADIFLCWKAGACLYIPTFTDVMMPAQFAAQHKLTVWSSVPTLANNMRALGALKPDSLSSLRFSFFCGEALPTSLMKEWQAAAPAGVIVNFYGPTEAAIFSTFYTYDKNSPPEEDIVPLGIALPGFHCRIGKDTSDSSDDDTGELLLSGPQVVAGYWNNEAATKKAFIRDEAGCLWYRTGDRVSLNDEDDFLFHGRCDRQLKIRGYRVELDEIESVLRRVTDSDLVAVVPLYAKDGRCEDIIAYCDNAVESEDVIKQKCSAFLPVYMLPRRVVQLDEFPRSTNGKIDYQALAKFNHESLAAAKSAVTPAL